MLRNCEIQMLLVDCNQTLSKIVSFRQWLRESELQVQKTLPWETDREHQLLRDPAKSTSALSGLLVCTQTADLISTYLKSQRTQQITSSLILQANKDPSVSSKAWNYHGGGPAGQRRGGQRCEEAGIASGCAEDLRSVVWTCRHQGSCVAGVWRMCRKPGLLQWRHRGGCGKQMRWEGQITSFKARGTAC